MVLIPDGYAQVNYKFTGANLPNGAEITLGIFLEGSDATPAEAAQEMIDTWDAANMEQFYGSGISMTSCYVKFGPTATGPSAEVFDAVSGTTGDPDSPNVCTLVRKITSQGGRSGRGRWYVPGARSPNIFPDGLYNTAALATLQSAVDAFWTGMGSGSFSPVVLHGAGAPIETPTLITGFEVQQLVATQRRRLRP